MSHRMKYLERCDEKIKYSTFEEFVFGLFSKGHFDSKTMERLSSFYGRKRLEELYRSWKAAKNAKDGNKSG